MLSTYQLPPASVLFIACSWTDGFEMPVSAVHINMNKQVIQHVLFFRNQRAGSGGGRRPQWVNDRRLPYATADERHNHYLNGTIADYQGASDT